MQYTSDQEFPGVLKEEQPAGPSLDGRLAGIIAPVVKTQDGMQTQYQAPRASPPLSHNHNGPSVEFAVGSTYGKVTIPGPKSSNAPAKRGRITDFSPPSSRRMRDKLNQCDRTRLSRYWYFTTLTYPFLFPRDRKIWRSHFRAFCKRLRRRYNIQAIVWKLEPQERLAPHYHLLIFSEDEIDNAVVAQMWYEVCDTGDPRHLDWHLGLLGGDNVPCTERVRSWDGVKSYCAKYCTKDVRGGDLPHWWHGGRWWGIEGKLPITIEKVEVTPREAFDLARMMRKLYKAKTGKPFKTNGMQGVKVYQEDMTTRRMLEHARQREKQRNADGDVYQPDLEDLHLFVALNRKPQQHINEDIKLKRTRAHEIEIGRREQERLERYGIQHKTPEQARTLLERYGFGNLDNSACYGDAK